MSKIKIQIPSSIDKIGIEKLEKLSKLITEIYLEEESIFWPQNGDYERTNLKELTSFIEKGELILAMDTTEIIGSVHVYPIEENICGFGMLISNNAYRGKGIGSLLVKSAEQWGNENGFRTMQLETLTPSKSIIPQKEFLKKWYTKSGYKLIKKIPYTNLYPKQAHLLKIDCQFEVYQKTI